jgi:hypothetical protein
VVDVYDLVEKYGAEAVRYFLLREVPATADADFTYEKFEARYNSDLANDLGNLLNRAVSMVHRYRGGTVPAPGASDALDTELRTIAEGIPARVETALAGYDPQEALDAGENGQRRRCRRGEPPRQRALQPVRVAAPAGDPSGPVPARDSRRDRGAVGAA